jgi:hypothetical protein
MTTSITLATLRTNCRNFGEIREQFIGNPEILVYINAAIVKLNGIIQAEDPERFLSSNDEDIVDGTATYALPADFLQLKGVDVKLDDGNWKVMQKFQWETRTRFALNGSKEVVRYRAMGANLRLHPTPDWTETGSVRLWYYPIATQLSGDSDTWNSIGYWDHYVMLYVTMMARLKAEENVTGIGQALRDYEKEIRRSMHVDRDGPERVRDRWNELRGRGPDWFNPDPI